MQPPTSGAFIPIRNRFTGLWRHGDFLRLWSGQTISVFGSMIGGTAMSFTAILVLKASPFQMGILSAMQMVPAFLIGLFAGAWVDRLRRRPLLIAADVGRALALASLPVAYLLGFLRIGQVYLVAFLVSILTIFFDVAYRSYLPALIGKDDLMEGNSKLSASAAVAEFGGFSIAGWLVQALTAPLAILVDAASFIVSAVTLGLIRKREPEIVPEAQSNMLREIAAGLQEVYQQTLLRASAAAIVISDLASGIFAALVVLYMSQELGFSPGVLGMIWAVGGASSFMAAALAPRFTRRLGIGKTLVIGMLLFGLSELFIPLAHGATLLSAIFLVCQQLGDGFYIMYDINLVSLRQQITAERLLGRVNATNQFLTLGATLVGSLIGGVLGQTIGLRPSLALAACGTLSAALVLWLSPLRKL
jgi:MFS family permease